jgi:hypothetical protein
VKVSHLSTEQNKYCCSEFKSLLEDRFFEEDKAELRSNGCFEREKYLIHCYDGLDVTIDMYIKYCPLCGADLRTDNIKKTGDI